jgi:hypothetical protein
MDEEEILRIGTSLQHMGFSDDQIDDYFEHHGVKGMHWGVRGTRRVQKILDRTNRIATGNASGMDRVLGANRFVFTKKGAARQLRRGAKLQAKINAGKKRPTNFINTMYGIKIKNLDYHQGPTGAAHAAGKQAAKEMLATSGSKKVSSISRNNGPQSDAEINKKVGAFLKNG